MLENVSSVTLGAISLAIGMTILLTTLLVVIGATSPRRGFLPWPTTWGDRFFVSFLVTIFISLFWLKFIEPFVPIEGALVVGVIFGTIIVKYG